MGIRERFLLSLVKFGSKTTTRTLAGYLLYSKRNRNSFSWILLMPCLNICINHLHIPLLIFTSIPTMYTLLVIITKFLVFSTLDLHTFVVPSYWSLFHLFHCMMLCSSSKEEKNIIRIIFVTHEICTLS